MLRHLSIRDFVIVDQLELEFDSGFGALTGETGAGKSILLDALGLALGGKAEAGMVRTGQARAEIVADFDLPAGSPLRDWLAEQEIDASDGSVLLRRVLESGGRSRAWLYGNGCDEAAEARIRDAAFEVFEPPDTLPDWKACALVPHRIAAAPTTEQLHGLIDQIERLLG